MGKRGPAPTPAALKKLRGNPGQRRIQVEAKAQLAPRGWAPPNHLHGEARREWFRIVAPLQACGILSVIDRAALAARCVAWARHVEAELMLRREGRMQITPNGCKVVNPWLTVSRQQLEIMKSFDVEFGLTPAARARMGAAMAQPASALDDETGSAAPQAGEFTGLIGKAN